VIESDRRTPVTERPCHRGRLRAAGVRWRLTSCLLPLLGALTAFARAAEPAPAPADTTLRIGEIRLELGGIFSPAEVAASRGANRTLRRAMDALHADTRPWVVEQELLFAPGDALDPQKLEESARNLRALGILNQVEVVPVDTTSDGRVTVRVAARETWTLSTSLSFALASSGDLRWSIAATEKNLLGWGLHLTAAVGHGLDASFGRIYVKQNRFLRSPLTCELNLDSRSDGYDRWLRVSLPFRANDQAWSVDAVGWQNEYETRWYLSNGGPSGAAPEREQSLYALLPRTSDLVELRVQRRLSPADRGRIWRVGLGVNISRLDYDLGDGLFGLSDGRTADLSYLAEPGQTLARDRGTEVWPQLILSSQGRTWVQTRFVTRYGNDEDLTLDPAFVIATGPAGPSLGSTTGTGERWKLSLGYSNWDQTGRSFWLYQANALATFGGADDRKHDVQLMLGSYLRFGDAGRPFTVKTFLEGVHGEALRGDAVSVLGLDRGLRTLDVDGMAGDQLLRWSSELGRTLPWVVLDIMQTGWGVFYDGGLARFADEARDLGDARHEVGCGLRFGSTRSGTSDLARFDVTYDLTAGTGFAITTVARGFF